MVFKNTFVKKILLSAGWMKENDELALLGRGAGIAESRLSQDKSNR